MPPELRPKLGSHANGGARHGSCTRYGRRMDTQTASTIALTVIGCVVAGLLWFVTGSLVQDHRRRRAEVYRREHPEEPGEQLRFELGPFSDLELRALFIYISNSVAVESAITREDLIRMGAGARRTAINWTSEAGYPAE